MKKRFSSLLIMTKKHPPTQALANEGANQRVPPVTLVNNSAHPTDAMTGTFSL